MAANVWVVCRQLATNYFIVGCGAQAVDVFDVTDFTLIRSISVPGLGCWPYGLTGCSENNCVDIPDHTANVIHRANISGVNSSTKWSVGRDPRATATTCCKNIRPRV